jgi:4-amino-4-deoxy-L-arabinose transferase-like glycosyltransferase
MNPPAILGRRGLFALLLVFTIVWFGTLDYRKLIKPDEGRYAEIAREMAVSGDFVTPRLNGLKYFEKPPLQYWVTATAFKVFGENEWTARLWPAVTGFLSILLAYITGRRLFGARAGQLAALTLGGSLFTIVIGHMNTLDMGLSFFLQLALSGMLIANHEPTMDRYRRAWMLLVWAALAGAVLSKGLVALVLPGGTLLAYSLAARDFSPWRRLELIRGIALFLAIAAPWFILVSLANPEFPHFFFIHEHFERFLSEGHRRTQPAWYFLAMMLVGTLPWALMTLQAWLGSWFRERSGRFQPQRLLFIWCVVILGFFSVSSSKLPSYILPMAPALAMLTGVFLGAARREVLLVHFGLLIPFAVLAVTLAPQIASYADSETPIEMMSGYAQWVTVAASLLLAGVLAGFLLVWRRREGAGLLLLAIAGYLAIGMVMQGHENLARSNSSHYIAQQVQPVLRPGVPFYSVGMYEQTLPFYLQRTFTLVDYRDELGFGLDQEPLLGIPTLNEFRSRWQAADDAFAVMKPETYSLLQESHLPMTMVARDTRRVIVRKPAL